MSSLSAFFCKELIEFHRSRKGLILLGIFIMFGMASPVLARYMQEIVSMAMGSEAPVLTAQPLWSDSWKQFYNNLAQVGGISILLLIMSSVSGEKASKTAALTLTKNLSPAQFILAKYGSSVLLAACAFLPALLLCWCYTAYLFDFAGKFQNILLSAVSYLMFVMVLLAVTILTSTAARTSASAAIYAFGGYLLLILSTYLPVVGHFLPGSLLSGAFSAVSGDASLIELSYPFIVGAVLILLCILLSVRLLASQEL